MNPENFDRTLRAFRRCIPFRPFIVEMLKGTRFEVACPESLAFNGDAAAYITPGGMPYLSGHHNVGQFICV